MRAAGVYSTGQLQYSYMDETYPVCGLDGCGAERKLEKRNKKIEAKK
jgi:hypothetical protein